MDKSGTKTIAQNRKAYHDYFVEDRYEAGIELFGTEVKSIRAGTLNLKDAFCVAKDGEVYAYSFHISPYDHGNIFNRDPDPAQAAAAAQAGNTKAPRPAEAGGLCADTAVGIFQEFPGEGGVGPVQGQEDLRQAGGRGQAGRQAGDGPRHAGEKPRVLNGMTLRGKRAYSDNK